jgi:hypothetical protein
VSTDGNKLSIETETATGSSVCSDAVREERQASISLSDDRNTLTLDYRPDGAVQVYGRE